MATITKQVWRMTFSNASGNTTSISLADPKANLTSAQIEAAMDLIIAKNIFLTAGGELVSKKEAKLINTTSDALYEQP